MSFSDINAGKLQNANDEGFTDGHHSGLRRGLNVGRQQGYEEGLDVGRRKGYKKGYDNGHRDGWDACLEKANSNIRVGNKCIAFLEDKLSVVVPALKHLAELLPPEVMDKLTPEERQQLEHALTIKVYEVERPQRARNKPGNSNNQRTNPTPTGGAGRFIGAVIGAALSVGPIAAVNILRGKPDRIGPNIKATFRWFRGKSAKKGENA
ncbi:MAG: hypothetical protein LBE22_05840 [Azoarcus sp.]|jgi:hypothetical protein|nr:hypothetical protein [Azoarcus sp.]